MRITRRRALASAPAALAAASLPRFAFAQGAAIKLGTIADTSGPLQPFGTQKLQCIQLAVEEINAAGGLLGRKIDLVTYDAQSNDQLYAQFAQQVALRDRVGFRAGESCGERIGRFARPSGFVDVGRGLAEMRREPAQQLGAIARGRAEHEIDRVQRRAGHRASGRSNPGRHRISRSHIFLRLEP